MKVVHCKKRPVHCKGNTVNDALTVNACPTTVGTYAFLLYDICIPDVIIVWHIS